MKRYEIDVHPSYGIIQFNRVTGGNSHFFGTAVNQSDYISLKIHLGSREVDMFGMERFRPDDRIPIIQAKMTNHQFATLITTMNIGEGSPCTLEYVNCEKVPPCPQQESQLDAVIKRAVEGVDETSDFVSGYLSEIRAIASKDKIGKKDAERIKHLITIISGRMEDNTKFYGKQIEEVGEKTVQQAKTEIDALLTHRIMPK